MAELLCIGVGNRCRRDDGVGPYVARLLREQHPPGLLVLDHAGEGGSLFALICGAPSVIVVDALVSGAAPGSLRRFPAHMRPLPVGCFAGLTHAFGLAEAVELARALGELPPRCVIYGIEGVCFTPGVGLSPPVEDTARHLAARITRLMCRWLR